MSLSLTLSTVIDQTYQLIEKIGEGGMSVVYRALDLSQNREVALKFLKEGVTSSFIEDVIRFKQEVTIISKLSDPGIIKLYGAGDYKGVPFIITELLQGINLSDFLLEQKLLPLSVTLDIMKQLVTSLNTMHLNGIIHRDLKPDNIMVQKEKDRLTTKILDFGLSLLLEFDQITSADEVAGTFGYMSPEGTGILKKKVDERSDLYSLGITFYQLLTGELPFKSKEISKLIHEQIAATPTPLRKIKSDVPPVLERMVLKLIQKDPELRYQSAKGLLYDIQRFQQGQTDFVIGEKDQKIKLSYQVGIMGREEELEKLKSLFAEVKSGRGQICLLEGEAGIGKNKLVEEIKKWSIEGHALFMEGRCLDQSNTSPYYPFKEAMNQYLIRMDRLETHEKDRQVQKLKESLGEFHEIAVRLHSGLAALIGPFAASASPPLARDAEHQRSLTVIANLFLNLSSDPVVLFLDDLQWADGGTLQLFEELASRIQDSRFFLVAATSPSENINRLVSDLKNQGAPLTTLALKPLSQPCLQKLIAHILGEKEESCLELTSYIFEKSQGNPLFSITVLREFVEEKALTWSENGWQADWEKIKKIPVPANLVHWILEKIKGLEKGALEFLSLCALIGQEIDIHFLFFMTPSSEEEALGLLDRAVSLQFLVPSSRGKMVFSHQKVRDYFLENLEPEKKKSYHYNIAQTLEIFYQNSESIFIIIKDFPRDKRNYYLKMARSMTESKQKLEPYYFKLAAHYEASGDKERTLEYALLAARKAREENANDQAFHFYKVVIRLLEEKGLGHDPECLAAKEALAEICLMTGKYEMAKSLFQEMLLRKENASEKLKHYRKVIETHLNRGDLDLAENYLREGLALLGDRIPARGMALGFALFKEIWVRRLHRFMPSRFLFEEGHAVSPEDQERVLFYLHLHHIYSLTHSKQFFWCSLKLLNLAESKIGKSKEWAASQAAFAFFAASRSWFKIAHPYFEKAVWFEQNEDAFSAKIFQSWGLCKMGEGQIKEGLGLLGDALEISRKSGDLWGESNTLEGLGYGNLLLGNLERAVFYYSQSLRISQRIADSLGICFSQAHLATCSALQGDFERSEDYANKALSLAQKKGSPLHEALAHLHFGILEIERTRYAEALAHLEKARLFVKKEPYLARLFTPLSSSLIEAQLEELKAAKSLAHSQRHQKESRLRAFVGPLMKQKHFPTLEEGPLMRVLGKYSAFKKNSRAAEACFKKSISWGTKLESQFELAKSYYEYARFLEERFSTHDFLKKSGRLFEEIGAAAYSKKISSISSAGVKIPRHSRFNNDRHMSVVLNTSRYLSSILDLDELLEKIMDSAIQLVGAERGLLFLYSEEGNLELRVLRNIEKGDIEDGRSHISRSIIQKVEKEKKALLIEDATQDSELKARLSVVKEQIKSVICVPILMRRDMLGVLYVENRLVSGAFSRDDLHALALIANQSGVSIENAKLYQRAITDGMTGLYNRIFFEEYLYKNLQLAQRYNKKLSLMIFDVDFFKQINDRYGHQAGDMVLQGVSQFLKTRLRQSDLASRFGGDEFAVILPETSLEQARGVGENLRIYASEQNFSYQGQTLKITLSIGVAEFSEGQNRLQLIEEADKALYAAKQAGRNQVKTSLAPAATRAV